MKDLTKRFQELQQSNPNIADYPLLMKAVRGKGYSVKMLTKAFETLISREDYSIIDKEDLINNLVKQTVIK